MKELDSVSSKRQRQLAIDCAFLKCRMKSESKRLKEVQSQLSPHSDASKYKAALSKANILHGLQQMSLTDLGKQGMLPSFTKKFENFKTQTTDRRIEMTEELLDNCISHYITTDVDKLRLKKKQMSKKAVTDEERTTGRPPSYLDQAAKSLVNSCRKILTGESSDQLQSKETVLQDLSSSRFKNNTSITGSQNGIMLKKNYSVNHHLMSDRSFKTKSNLIAAKTNSELESSRSLLGRSICNTITAKHPPERYIKKRDLGSIKAAELFPKIKYLLQDSVSLLAVKPRKNLTQKTEESSLQKYFTVNPNSTKS